MSRGVNRASKGKLVAMKLSLVISAQPASFSALAYKGRLEENIAKLAGFGYDGVELAVRDPEALDADALRALTRSLGLTIPAIGTGQIYGEDGLSFTSPDASVREGAIERVKAHIRLARELEAIVIIGLVRGRRAVGVTADQAEAWLVEALRACASTNPAVKLAIEPINRYETDLVNTVASGLGLVGKVAADNVGLLLDSFHMNIEESSMTAAITKSGDRLFHFHVADSNRWHAGAGHTDFAEILGALQRAGYTGFLSAEILPFPGPDAAARNNIATLHRILRCLPS